MDSRGLDDPITTSPPSTPPTSRRAALVLAGAAVLAGGGSYLLGRGLSPDDGAASPVRVPKEHEPAPETTPPAADPEGTMPDLLQTPLAELDLDALAGQEVRSRAVVDAAAGESLVTAQEPAPGDPLTGRVQLTLRGAAATVPLGQGSEAFADTAPARIGARTFEQAVTLDPERLADGLEIQVPHGALALTWHAWLSGASETRAALVVTDAAGRRRQRTPLNERTAQRARIAVTGGERLRLSVDQAPTEPVLLADASFEALA